MRLSEKYIPLLLFLTVITSCDTAEKFSDPADNKFLRSRGIFIVNEGNFMSGNGSVSFYSTDSVKIFNDLFFLTNNRPLGDVPNSVTLFRDKAFIVVNNSGKIEITEAGTLKSIATIKGLAGG